MNPKSLLVAALCGAAIVSTFVAPTNSHGQVDTDDPVVMRALLNEVTAQQAILVDNQGKIDTKLAGIADTLRLARIYVGRGGGKVP
jgi:hypothetical protein